MVEEVGFIKYTSTYLTPEPYLYDERIDALLIPEILPPESPLPIIRYCFVVSTVHVQPPSSK